MAWWEDDNFGYVELVMGANDAAKNRAAATAGKFSDFDYLRVAWGKAARDDPTISTSSSAPTRPSPTPSAPAEQEDATTPSTTT